MSDINTENIELHLGDINDNLERLAAAVEELNDTLREARELDAEPAEDAND